MGQITLTKDGIEDDIAVYEQRVLSALNRLKALPAVEYQTRKDRATRRVIGSEVDHVNRMIQFAEQALARVSGSST